MRQNIGKSVSRRRRIQASEGLSYDDVLDRFLDYCEHGLFSAEELGIAISKWLSNDDFYDFVRANYYDEIFYDEY